MPILGIFASSASPFVNTGSYDSIATFTTTGSALVRMKMRTIGPFAPGGFF